MVIRINSTILLTMIMISIAIPFTILSSIYLLLIVMALITVLIITITAIIRRPWGACWMVSVTERVLGPKPLRAQPPSPVAPLDFLHAPSRTVSAVSLPTNAKLVGLRLGSRRGLGPKPLAWALDGPGWPQAPGPVTLACCRLISFRQVPTRRFLRNDACLGVLPRWISFRQATPS